jgi:signal transduction histidine kinase
VIRPVTLRGRLALSAALTAAVWVGVLTAGFNVVLARQLHLQADEVLRTRAAAAAALIDVGRDGRLRLREPADDQALDTDIWVYQGARAVERPPGRAWLQREADRAAERPGGFRQAADGPATRLYAFGVRVGGRHIATVVAAAAVGPYERAATLALWGSAAFALLLLGGIYAVTRTVVSRALRPVDQMTQQAADWSAHDVEHRFGVGARPAELDALAGTLDALLARQAAVVRHERQLSAELSHELRTPLASILAETELLTRRARSEAETARGHAAVAAAAERMDRIIETLLSDARTRTGGAPGRCEVVPVIEAAIRPFRPARGPVVVVTPQPDRRIAVGLRADVVERILAPLLENALRYADSVVVVTASVQDGWVDVAVRNDGPRVPAEWHEAIFEPGRRADPADGHGGAGLGLALARRLARAGGGDVRVGPSEDGTTFLVSLPPA